MAVAGDTGYDVKLPYPPSDLVSALNQFATTSGIALSIDATVLHGKTTSTGLNGNYSVERGLHALLDGSEYKQKAYETMHLLLKCYRRSPRL